MPPRKQSKVNASSSSSSTSLRHTVVDPYHLLLPPCEASVHAHGKGNCTQNARCLFGLGEKSSRGIWAAEPHFLSVLGPNPSESKRSVMIRPAGMHNLGATCYLNALMQALFFNLPFRALIYAWKPHPLSQSAAKAAASGQVHDLMTSSTPDFDSFMTRGGGEGSIAGGEGGGGGGGGGGSAITDAEKKELARFHLASSDAQDMLVLQQLFSDLHLSLRSAVNVRQFVNRLQLEAGYQQDANEFSKKLMEHIGPILDRADQLPQKLRNGIKDMFCGRLETMTKCLGCRSESTRVENFEADGFRVPFRGKKNLEDALQALFAKETMTGDNLYECDLCKAAGSGRQPADRSLVVLALPPVLNLQLVRFEYNLKHGDKEKVKDAIEIPDIIDLAAIVRSTNESGYRVPPTRSSNGSGGTSSSPPSAVYELTAVLYHKGQSAHHGHYIADVWDPERALWWHFDDETVTPVATANAKSNNAFTSSSSLAEALEPAYDESAIDLVQNISSIKGGAKVGKAVRGRSKNSTAQVDIIAVDAPDAPSIVSVNDKKGKRVRNSAASIEEVSSTIKKAEKEDHFVDIEKQKKSRGVSRVSDISDVVEIKSMNGEDEAVKGKRGGAASSTNGNKRSSSNARKSAPQIRISESMSSSFRSSASILRKKDAHVIGGVPPLNPLVSVPDLVAEESTDAPHTVFENETKEEVVIDRSTWTNRRSHPLFRTGPGSKDAYMLVYSRVEDDRLQQWNEYTAIAQTGTTYLPCLPPPPQDVYVDAKALFAEAKQGSSSSSSSSSSSASSTSSFFARKEAKKSDSTQLFFDMRPPHNLYDSVATDNQRFKESMAEWANERIRRLALIDRRRALYSVLFLDPYNAHVPQSTDALYTSHGQRAPTLPLVTSTDGTGDDNIEIHNIDSDDMITIVSSNPSKRQRKNSSSGANPLQKKEARLSLPLSSDSSEPIFYWLPTSWLRMWVSGEDLREIEADDRKAAEAKRLAKSTNKSSKNTSASAPSNTNGNKENSSAMPIDLSSGDIDLTLDDDFTLGEASASAVKFENDDGNEGNKAQGVKNDNIVDLANASGDDGATVHDLRGDSTSDRGDSSLQHPSMTIQQKSSSAILASSSMDNYQRRKPTDVFHDPVWSVWIENPSAVSSTTTSSSFSRPPLQLLEWLELNQTQDDLITERIRSHSSVPFLNPDKAHLFKAVSPRVFHSIMKDLFPTDDPNLEVAKISLYRPVSGRKAIYNIAVKAKAKTAAARASKKRKIGNKGITTIVDDDDNTANESVVELRDDNYEPISSTTNDGDKSMVKTTTSTSFNADARMDEILSLSGPSWCRQITWDVVSKYNFPHNWALSSLNYRDDSLEKAFLINRMKAERIIHRNTTLIALLSCPEVKDPAVARTPPPVEGSSNFYWVGKKFIISLLGALKNQNTLLLDVEGGSSTVFESTHIASKKSATASSSSSGLMVDDDKEKVAKPQQSTLLNLGFTLNSSSSSSSSKANDDTVQSFSKANDDTESNHPNGQDSDINSRSIVSIIVENPLYNLPSLEDLILSPKCDEHQALHNSKAEVLRVSSSTLAKTVTDLYGKDVFAVSLHRFLPADEPFHSSACEICKEMEASDTIEKNQDAAERNREFYGEFKKLDHVRKRNTGFPSPSVSSSNEEFEGKLPQGEFYLFEKPWLVQWRKYIAGKDFRPDSFPAPWNNLQCTCKHKLSEPRCKVPLRLLQFVSSTSRPNYARTRIRSSKKSSGQVFSNPLSSSSSSRLIPEHQRRSSTRDHKAEELMRIQSVDFPKSIHLIKDSPGDNSLITKLKKGMSDWNEVTDSNFCGVASPADPVLEHDFAAGVELILPEEFELFNRLYKWIPTERDQGRGVAQDISEHAVTLYSAHSSDAEEMDSVAPPPPHSSSSTTDNVVDSAESSSTLEAITAQHILNQKSCPSPVRLIVLNRFEVSQRVSSQDVNSQNDMIVVAGDNHVSVASEKANSRSALTWTLDPPLCSTCFSDTCSENLLNITSFDNGAVTFVERLPSDAVIQESGKGAPSATATAAAAATTISSSRPKRSRSNKARISTKLENLASTMRMYDIRMLLLNQIDEASVMQAFLYHPRTNLPIFGNPTLREANIRDGDEIKYSLPGNNEVGDTSCVPRQSQESVDGNDADLNTALAVSASMSTVKGDTGSKRGKEKGFTGSRFGGAAADTMNRNSSKPGIPPKNWTCRTCTFENAAGERKCGVCGGN
jgi:hypothetical protein